MSLLFVINHCGYDIDQALRLREQLDTLGYESILIPDFDSLKLKNVALWCRRYLAPARTTKAEYIIKLDPDAWINSRIDLETIPDADVFGSIPDSRGGFTGGAFPFGGIIGMRVSAAKRVYGLLGTPRLSHMARWYTRPDEHGVSTYRAPIEEDVLSIVATRLKLTIADWHSIKCVYRPYQSPNQDYSIIHPVAY